MLRCLDRLILFGRSVDCLLVAMRVKVPFVPSGAGSAERWGGMDMDLNFYWTAADTVSALVSAGGAVLALSFDRVYKLLARR